MICIYKYFNFNQAVNITISILLTIGYRSYILQNDDSVSQLPEHCSSFVSKLQAQFKLHIKFRYVINLG